MSGVTLKLGDGFPKFNSELSTQVKELQGLLRKWGYEITETGYFDWATDSALIHFQRYSGLSVDGKVLVGAGKTWKALQKPPPLTPPGRSLSVVALESVPFISQFDEIHVKGAGLTGCFAASETMLRAVGVKQAGPANKYQIVTKETWDASALKDGLAYLDGKLNKGTPVMVGVSYSNEAKEKGYNENITEHFVVIFAKKGDGTYIFHDPATSSKSMGASRKFSKDSTTQRLIAEGIPGQEGYAVGARYFVTMIRKNDE